jgi:DNA-binding transcriptional ArsR family regulator
MSHLPETFAALGNPVRFAIVERLLHEGELPAGEFIHMAHLSAPAISRHFKVLRQAGIIAQRVDKQRRLYSVRPEAVQEINDWAMSYRSFWQGSLDRLGAALIQGHPRA